MFKFSHYISYLITLSTLCIVVHVITNGGYVSKDTRERNISSTKTRAMTSENSGSQKVVRLHLWRTGSFSLLIQARDQD